MKRIIVLLALVGTFSGTLDAQPKLHPGVKPNYELASQFSAKRIGQMVFSTAVEPKWFRDSDRFWCEWKTPEGTRYWIVDPETGRKT